MIRRISPAWYVAVAVTVAALVGAVLVGGYVVGSKRDRPPQDPRAYAVSSGEVPLDTALERAGIAVPACLRNDLRYALVDNGFGYYYNIYLRLESSVDCMDTFLLANAMRDTFQATRIGGTKAERPLLYREKWMDDDIVQQIGWEIGADDRFQKFSIGNEKLYSVDALVQHVPESTRVRAYVYAFRGG